MRVRSVVFVVVVIVLLFLTFVPVIRFDTNVSPQCAINRLPCPLAIDTPITGHAVYWSITAYYFGFGAFLVAFTDYGFIS
jgi:hypothetical protein